MVAIKEINYSIPIKEYGEENNEFKIKGVAINETTTSNGHKFLAEELSSAVTSLNGVPLLKDHINSVDSIIGRVKTAIFNEVGKNITFEAIVNDKNVREMIKDGRLNSVSVGAVVKDLEEDEDGSLIARGIMFKELSAVAVPADMGATFSVALMEAYNSEKSDDTIKLKGGKITMSEEAEKPEAETEKPVEPEAEAEAPAPAVEDTADADAVAERLRAIELEIQKAKLDAKEKELANLKSVKEADADEAKDEAEDEDEDEVEEKSGYKVLAENGFGSTSFTVVRNKY